MLLSYMYNKIFELVCNMLKNHVDTCYDREEILITRLKFVKIFSRGITQNDKY